MQEHPEVCRDLFKYQKKLRQLVPSEVPRMGFSVVPLVQAGLAAWTAYQCYTTGKNIVNDPKVQKSWEKRQYIDTLGHTVPHLPVFGDAMRGGRALAQGNSKEACLWPANAIFTIYGGKVIGKGFRSIFNRVIPEINKLRFGRWINKQGGKVVKGGIVVKTKVKLPFDADTLLKNSAAGNKNGLTNAGRAFQKHVNRPGDTLSGIKFSGTTANKDAQKIIEEILTSPNRKVAKLKIGGYRVYDSVTKKCFDVSRTGNFNGFRNID